MVLCMALMCMRLLYSLHVYSTSYMLNIYTYILYYNTGLLRTRLQASGMHGSVNYKSPTDGIVQIFQTEGFKGFFRVAMHIYCCIYRYTYINSNFVVYLNVIVYFVVWHIVDTWCHIAISFVYICILCCHDVTYSRFTYLYYTVFLTAFFSLLSKIGFRAQPAQSGALVHYLLRCIRIHV